MLRYSSILLVLVFTRCITSQTSQAAGISCPNNNPFIKLINIPLYQQPAITSRVCAFEFAIYGTCCDQWTIPSSAQLQARFLQDDVKRVNKEYALFHGVLPKLYHVLKRAAFAPLHNLRQDWNQKIGLAKSLFHNPHLVKFF